MTCHMADNQSMKRQIDHLLHTLLEAGRLYQNFCGKRSFVFFIVVLSLLVTIMLFFGDNWMRVNMIYTLQDLHNSPYTLPLTECIIISFIQHIY